MLCSQARHSRLAPERIFLNFLTGTCEQRILSETGPLDLEKKWERRQSSREQFCVYAKNRSEIKLVRSQ